MTNASKTVVVGMSGGVDSSVTALLLKEQGYRVIGVFMKNWEEIDSSGQCQSERDYQDVARVCETLDIPYYSVNFVEEYREHVFKHFLDEYRAGHTPNPDILCNREIKFNVFLKKALSLGADYLATGHYARNLITPQGHQLAKGLDGAKDQTYFLYTISQDILAKVLFPIGHLPKGEVRALAKAHGLSTHNKKDSTGICFIGERDFTEFLGQYLAFKPGSFQHLNGKVVGTHKGVAYYTLGQRRGLGLGGEGECWYVVGKNIEKNIVYVERGDTHPALYADWLTATECSWVAGVPPQKQPFECTAKVRYRQVDQPCTVTHLQDGRLKVEFNEPQRAITPRQSVVFYQNDICLGGAMIENHGPTHYEMNRALPTKT